MTHTDDEHAGADAAGGLPTTALPEPTATLEAQAQDALVDTITAVHEVLASSGVQLAPTGAGDGYLTWTAGGMHCALAIGSVRELLPSLPRVTSLPDSPDWLAGLFLHDNEIIALADPVHVLGRGQHDGQRRQAIRRALSGVGAISRAPMQAVVIGDEEVKLGLLVDEVAGVVYGMALPITDHSPFGQGAEIQVGNGRAYRTLDARALIDALVRELASAEGSLDDGK
ncbi:MAG TPA: chemotaxis protein CheW [Ktedonobacterales bacterium]